MPVTSSCIAYNGLGGTGNARLYFLQAGARYLGMTWAEVYEDLTGWKQEGRIRSLRVLPAAGGNGGTTVIVLPTAPTGACAQIHRVTDLGVPYDLTDVDPMFAKSYLFMGLILINTDRPGRSEIMRSVRGVVDQIAPQITAQLNSSNGLTVTNGPRVSWFWSHKDEPFLHPQRAYAQVFVRLKYDPDSIWFDPYQIDMRFWIDFWVHAGALNVAISRYSYHVSKGHLAKYVGAIAWLAAELTVERANNSLIPPIVAGLNAQLSALGRTPTDAFLLPGDQSPALTLLGNTVFVGDSRDDATLVIETQP